MVLKIQVPYYLPIGVFTLYT